MLGLVLFFCLIFFFTLTSMVYGPRPQSEGKDYMIEIATIERKRAVPNPIVYSRPSRSKIVVKRAAPARPVADSQHPLYDSCVSALVNLGEKKTVASSSAKKILASNDVKSVEDFIRIAFSR